MKYIALLVSTLFLSSCAMQSANDRFYEEVWKPRPTKTLSVTNLAPEEEEPAEEVIAEEASAPEPRVEFIRVQVMNPVYQGIKYLDYTEKENRSELKELTGVDPVRIEWCAAFANAILEESSIISNKDHQHPLLARSFLQWGEAVDDPQMGDVVVFPRGNEGWQGHVGFYVKEQMIDGVLYYYILGGNQNNSVTVKLFRADSALGIRRNN